MNENVSPNKELKSRVKNEVKAKPKKSIQTTIICGLNRQITLNYKISKTNTNCDMSSQNKRIKTEENSDENQCSDCVLIECRSDSPVPEVDPRLEDDSDIECLEVIPNDGVFESVAEEEMPLEEEYEKELKNDCLGNNPTVEALKSLEQIRRDCLELDLDLDLNTDSDDEGPEEPEFDDEICITNAVDFEVESIYDSGVDEKNRKMTFLVKWKNWSEEHNTWEPMTNLRKCNQLVDEYKYIRRLGDQQLMTVYHNYYKLKGIIEDLCERKVSSDVMTTILLIFNDIPLKDFNYTKVFANKMRTDLRDSHSLQMDEIFGMKNIDKRIVRIKSKYNEMLYKLNITKKFGSFDKFYDFFTKRKYIEHKLIKWEKEVNAIIAKEREGQPIRLENLVDCDVPPLDFQYISKCRSVDPTIIVADDPPLYCQCTNCESEQSQCCVSTYQSPIVYTKNAILESRYGRSAIYECNRKCECSQSCINRVVQKGRKHKLAIFRTDDDKGWGVRALEFIQKGSFVMEYVGEVIRVEEADKRGAQYDAEGLTYLFDLDFAPDEEDSHQYTLDATKCGNVSHFVNHSCDPNLDTRAVWINNLDPFMPHIALFAVRNIRLNEELTFDYKINVHGITDANQSQQLVEKDSTVVSDKSFDSGIDNSDRAETEKQKVVQRRVTCRCGADNCRKFLY